jgi:hypothetical protein
VPGKHEKLPKMVSPITGKPPIVDHRIKP